MGITGLPQQLTVQGDTTECWSRPGGSGCCIPVDKCGVVMLVKFMCQCGQAVVLFGKTSVWMLQ